MGYEVNEPVALCDGCGQGLSEGDKCWALEDDPYFNNSAFRFSGYVLHGELQMRNHKTHYCCITPCLEKAVVAQLRALRAASTTPPTTTETQPPLLPSY